MKNYLDQLDIEQYPLQLQLQLSAITDNGIPTVAIIVNELICFSGKLGDLITINRLIPLLDCINIKIILSNKIYSEFNETGIKIQSLTVDGHNLVPNYCDCISYVNDQNQNVQAFYLGFNGTWSFNIDEPFYRWWHRASGQGWLLEPAPI